MTTTKEQLLIAIESTPEPILAQILDYLEYLKTKPTRPTARSRTVPIPDGEPLKRGSQAKDLLKTQTNLPISNSALV